MKISIIVLLGLVLASGPVAAQQAPGLIAKNPIRLTNVEGRMDHLGVDLKGQRLFATAFDNHTLEVLDLKTGRQMHTIPALNEPQGAYYDPATSRLFVACGGDGTVQIFDGTTYRLLQTVTLDLDADNVRYDNRSRHIVVGYGGEKFLAGKVTRPGEAVRSPSSIPTGSRLETLTWMPIPNPSSSRKSEPASSSMSRTARKWKSPIWQRGRCWLVGQ
jgi:WD40 repeat protein